MTDGINERRRITESKDDMERREAMTEPTALDEILEKCDKEFFEWKTEIADEARAELSRLRDCERELAAMREGGVWLKRWTEPPTEGLVVCNPKESVWTSFRAEDSQSWIRGNWGKVAMYHPPHEGRDDG